MHLSPVGERSWVTTLPAVYQTWEIAICRAIPSVRSIAGLLSIQRVVMLRPPLQELELSVSVVRPPLTKRVFRGLRSPGFCRGRGWGPGNGYWGVKGWGVKQIRRVWARRWIRLRLVRYRTVPSGYLWLIQIRWGWMLWYRLGRGFFCTPFPDRSLNEETVRPEVETQGAETASMIQLTAHLVQCWSSCRPVSPQG